MFEDIKNKRILITGATGGLGSAMTLLFAEYSTRLGLHYRNDKDAALKLVEETRKKGGEAKIFQADLLDFEAVKRLVPEFAEKFDGIDVLINNAGIAGDYKHFSELSEKSWEDIFHLNIKAPFYLTGAAFPYMQKQNWGRVINISSVNVKYGGSGKSMHYVASKAALESITRSFAKEGAPYNILVNAIRCGFINTPMRRNTPGYSEEDMKRRIEKIPLKRMGEPIDIARMALFLASEGGNFITGEVFTVAGGD